MSTPTVTFADITRVTMKFMLATPELVADAFMSAAACDDESAVGNLIGWCKELGIDTAPAFDEIMRRLKSCPLTSPLRRK